MVVKSHLRLVEDLLKYEAIRGILAAKACAGTPNVHTLEAVEWSDRPKKGGGCFPRDLKPTFQLVSLQARRERSEKPENWYAGRSYANDFGRPGPTWILTGILYDGATRCAVYRLISYPSASDPRCKALSILRKSFGFSSGLRPARGLRLSGWSGLPPPTGRSATDALGTDL